MHEKALLPNYIYMRINELNEPKKSNNEIKSNSNNKLNINTEHQERLCKVNILTTF